MTDFRILGPLEVLGDAGPIDLGGGEERALLALLLLEPGRVVSGERVVEALWCGNTPPDAGARVGACVSRLQQALGPEIVHATSRGLRLRIPPGQLDVDRFRVLVEAADRAPARMRAEKLRHALALWRGPALADFAEAHFARPYIERLAAQRAAVEERLAEETQARRRD